MGMAEFTILTDRAVLSVSGAEAQSFLQGLITNDTAHAEQGLYAALLTPQGKILFDFLLLARDGGYLIDCAADQRAALQKRLTLYRLRAKVEIAPRDDLAVAWAKDPAALPDGYPDPRLSALGARAFVPGGSGVDGNAAYLAHRLSLGVPESIDFGQDKMFALDAGLEELHGVSFGKGCYVGQELTARMKHRSTARKRLLLVESAGDAPTPAPGTAIIAGDVELGAIVSTYGRYGFAPIRLDRLAEAGTAPASANGHPITLHKQTWLSPAQ
jgi:folate-binding protein YgfZ